MYWDLVGLKSGVARLVSASWSFVSGLFGTDMLALALVLALDWLAFFCCLRPIGDRVWFLLGDCGGVMFDFPYFLDVARKGENNWFPLKELRLADVKGEGYVFSPFSC